MKRTTTTLFMALSLGLMLPLIGCDRVEEADDETDTSGDYSSDADTDIDTDTDSGSDSDSDVDTDSDGPGEWNGNGVWYDWNTDLSWQDPPYPVRMEAPWPEEYCGSLTLGGYADWRLPTIDELRSLLNDCPSSELEGECQVTDGSWADAWSEECQGCSVNGGAGAKGCYWDPSLFGYCGEYMSSSWNDPGGEYWMLNYNSGEIDLRDQETSSYFRCVRDGLAEGDDLELEYTWYETGTDLCWENPPDGPKKNWYEATDYCADLSLESHSDWRVPTIDELRTLVVDCPSLMPGGACQVTDGSGSGDWEQSDCASYEECLPWESNTLIGYYWNDALCGAQTYWSSSTVANQENYGWRVSYGSGEIKYGPKDSPIAVRCVRTGPC